MFSNWQYYYVCRLGNMHNVKEVLLFLFDLSLFVQKKYMYMYDYLKK